MGLTLVSSWERANESSCEQAIATLGEQTDLYDKSKQFSGPVNAVLKHLKAGKYLSFRFYKALTMSKRLASITMITPLKIHGSEAPVGFNATDDVISNIN